MIKAVIDTNVLVAALLSPFGASARVLDLTLSGDIAPLFDDRILAEYRDVLLRKKFGFDANLVEDLLDYFKAGGGHITSRPLRVKLCDPDDAPFLEVALSGKADALITWNKRHYPRGKSYPRVMSPKEFLTTGVGH